MNTLTLERFLSRSNLNTQRQDGLCLFDYNKTVTFTFDWDELTINARGIVFEEATGKLIARPFPKFWNYEELQDERASKLPLAYRPNFQGAFMALEKADGSCGIAYYYNGKWRVNTRGSFQSDQARWAETYLNEKLNTSDMNIDNTYIFEIVYPENRIVVDYGNKEALVLIGIIVTETGEELWYDEMKSEADVIGCEIVELFIFDKFEDLFKARDLLTVNEEGYVITFRNGYKLKIKGEAYCNVHRKMSSLTPLTFWKNFDTKTQSMPTDFVSELPEEFRDTVDLLTQVTVESHKDEFERVKRYANAAPEFDNTAKGNKARYLYISDTLPNDYVHLVISYLNDNINKVYDNIHRKLRPTNNSFKGVKLDPRLQRILDAG